MDLDNQNNTLKNTGDETAMDAQFGSPADASADLSAGAPSDVLTGASSENPSVNVNKASLSGTRALANLMMLEHDFRRARTSADLARLVVTRLGSFTHFDGVVFWLVKGQKISELRVTDEGGRPAAKAAQQWGKLTAEWLVTSKTPIHEINPDHLPAKIQDSWPDHFAMTGCHIVIKNPSGQLAGGLMVLREKPLSEPVQVMIEQLAETLGYNLRALELGIFRAVPQYSRALLGLLVLFILAIAVYLAVETGQAPDFLTEFVEKTLAQSAGLIDDMLSRF